MGRIVLTLLARARRVSRRLLSVTLRSVFLPTSPSLRTSRQRRAVAPASSGRPHGTDRRTARRAGEEPAWSRQPPSPRPIIAISEFSLNILCFFKVHDNSGISPLLVENNFFHTGQTQQLWKNNFFHAGQTQQLPVGKSRTKQFPGKQQQVKVQLQQVCKACQTSY